MAETGKLELYSGARREIAALVDGLRDPIAAMASCSSVLHSRLPHSTWTGFYRVVEPELLRIGPYQGAPGCIEIPFARGVCGAAARRRASLVVPDVHAFADHIACDPTTRSEIVVPVLDPKGDLVAVLDLDSDLPAAFDETDREELEAIAALLAPAWG